MCPRCLALKDKVVGYTDEDGVTLPPLHPRCRCAIMYREIWTANNPAKNESPTKERAIIDDNGKRNGYTANFQLMNSKAYHDRFENLTEHKAVNEALYKQATKILGRRSGTEYEELIVLDARTGKLLAHNADAVEKRTFQCGLSQVQADSLIKLGKTFELLHNHPNSSYPSTADVISLFTKELAAGSTVVCHNGTIYHMTKLEPFDAIKNFVSQIRSAKAEELLGYPEHMIELHTAKDVMKLLIRKGTIKFKELT